MLNGTYCEKLDSSLHLSLPALIYSSLSSTLQFSKWKSENWEINETYERKEDNPTLAKRLVLKKSWQIGSKRAEHKPVAGGGDVFSEGQVSAAQETQQMVRRPLEKLTNNGFPIYGHMLLSSIGWAVPLSVWYSTAIVGECGFLPCDLWGFPGAVFVTFFCCQAARWLGG